MSATKTRGKGTVEQADVWDDYWAVDEAEQQRQQRRLQEITRHCEYWAMAFPEWDGPKVGELCEVHTVMAYSLKAGREVYRYMAPCRILEISPDRETYLVAIDYAPGSSCFHMNGEQLRLDILQVWPPVAQLRGHRQ